MDRRAGRLDADPGGLAGDRLIGPVRLLGMARSKGPQLFSGTVAMIRDDVGSPGAAVNGSHQRTRPALPPLDRPGNLNALPLRSRSPRPMAKAVRPSFGQATAAPASFLFRRQAKKPRPEKPRSIIAQVDDSGTTVAAVMASWPGMAKAALLLKMNPETRPEDWANEVPSIFASGVKKPPMSGKVPPAK